MNKCNECGRPLDEPTGLSLEACSDSLSWGAIREYLSLPEDTPLTEEDAGEFEKKESVEYIWDHLSAEKTAEVLARWTVCWADAIRKACKERDA